MTDILELAKRVEALHGPCRETDEEICDALFTERHRTCIKGLSDADGGMNMWRYPKGYIANALRFTDSLDAAMTLVPNDWVITDVTQRLPSNQNWEWSVDLGQLIDGDWNFVRAVARKCPPNGFAIALTAAALRAIGETK